MDDPKLSVLRKFVSAHESLVYAAVKAGAVDDLPHESQLYAKVVREHMHLKHVHNALEFADLREGTPYETTFNGDAVSPSAHLALHAAVKGQLEADPLVRAAFDKLVATGTSAHHAEHVLCALLAETQFEELHALDAGEDSGKQRAIYVRKLQNLARDSAFRKKLTQNFPADHPAFG
jgi:uncharacterized lipoprotein NlpE involved in copper resistance